MSEKSENLPIQQQVQSDGQRMSISSEDVQNMSLWLHNARIEELESDIDQIGQKISAGDIDKLNQKRLERLREQLRVAQFNKQEFSDKIGYKVINSEVAPVTPSVGREMEKITSTLKNLPPKYPAIGKSFFEPTDTQKKVAEIAEKIRKLDAEIKRGNIEVSGERDLLVTKLKNIFNGEEAEQVYNEAKLEEPKISNLNGENLYKNKTIMSEKPPINEMRDGELALNKRAEELGRDKLYDDTIMQINKKVSRINNDLRKIKKQTSNHFSGKINQYEIQKSTRHAYEELEILKLKRKEHIKEIIRNATPEEIEAIKLVADKVSQSPVEVNKDEAEIVLQLMTAGFKNSKNEIEATATPSETLLTEKMGVNNGDLTTEHSGVQKSDEQRLVALEQEIKQSKLNLESHNNLTSTEKESFVNANKREEIENHIKLIEGEISNLKESVVNIEPRDLNPIKAEEVAPEEAQNLPVDESTPYTVATSSPENSSLQKAPVATDWNVFEENPTPESGEAGTPDASNQLKATGAESKPETAFTKILAGIQSEDPARAERILKTIGASAEMRERIEKLFATTEIQSQKIDKEISTKDSWVIERALKIGSWYRMVPLKKKLIASTLLLGGASALAAIGGAGPAIIATAALTGSGVQRLLGSLAVATAIEGVLTKRSIVRNEEEKKVLGMRMNVVLGALAGSGVFLGGKLLGEYLSSGSADIPKSTASAHPGGLIEPLNIDSKEIFDKVKKDIDTTLPLEMATGSKSSTVNILTPEKQLFGEHTDTPTTFESTYEIKKGDNLWNIVKEKIPEIKALEMLEGADAKQSNAIANLIEQIKKDPASFGISSGNVDSLSVGDTLNMEKIHSVLENTKISVDGSDISIIDRAQGLSEAEISNIESNNEALAQMQPESTVYTPEQISSNPIGEAIEKVATAGEINVEAERIFRSDIQYMFGSKGLFGYGFLGSTGEKSLDWLDLKGRTVNEIISKKFEGGIEGGIVGDEGGVTKFGIDSFGAVDKIKGYIKLLTETTGLTPSGAETAEQFLKRAAQAIASKK